MRTINDVRDDLKCWGKFWAQQEMGQGYASKSNIEMLREKLRLGCSAPGTSHLISHLADSIKIPDHLSKIDHYVELLEVKHKVALRQYYVSNLKVYSPMVREAERELL